LAALIRSSAETGIESRTTYPGHRPSGPVAESNDPLLSGSCRESHLIADDKHCRPRVVRQLLPLPSCQRTTATGGSSRADSLREQECRPPCRSGTGGGHPCFVFYVRPGRVARWQVGKKSPAVPVGSAGVSLVR
jgi:hypothetical protein